MKARDEYILMVPFMLGCGGCGGSGLDGNAGAHAHCRSCHVGEVQRVSVPSPRHRFDYRIVSETPRQLQKLQEYGITTISNRYITVQCYSNEIKRTAREVSFEN